MYTHFCMEHVFMPFSDTTPSHGSGTPGITALRADGIVRRYGKREILSGCSIRADEGECVGITGRNGCGKSTLLAVLSGMSRPSGGSVVCFGRDLLRDRKGFGELIGYVPQTNPLIGELTAWDNLRLLSGGSVSRDDEVLENLSIKDMLRTRVSLLSGGMKRRVAIACALIGRPPVLIMDEPTSALDLFHKSVIYDNLEAYRRSGGIIIMATHDVAEMRLCSRLYLINQGSAEETDAESAVSLIKGGVSND